MFTFLRRLRNGLLGDGSRSRYFFYAVGEIALVVIGILIAFQVNEWGNERSQRIKEKEILTLLLDDLKDDEVTLVTFTGALEREEFSIAYVLAEIHKNIDRDSLEYYAREAISGYAYRPIFPTFQGLSQSGNLDLISDARIRDSIIRFHGYTISYLEDLCNKYQLLRQQATTAFLPYFGYQMDQEGTWQFRTTRKFIELKNDDFALNALSAAGQIRSWLQIRINTIFLVVNRKLQKDIQRYLATFDNQE